MPFISTDTSSISAMIHNNGSLMVLDSDSNEYGVGRLFNHQGIIQAPGNENGGNCRIHNIHVVRGRRNYVEIDHSGFTATITDRDDIIINVGHILHSYLESCS